MRITVLCGEFDVAIDEKNRLLIPAEIRRALDPERDGDAFFITIGENRQPWLFPERRYETFVSQMESELTPDEDRLAFDQTYFGVASRVEWDKQGRVLIPEKIRGRTQLNREITLVGTRDHLELWNRPAWDARVIELESMRAEIAARQRASKMAGIVRPAALPAAVQMQPVAVQPALAGTPTA